MQKIELQAEKRDILGKKTKNLRSQGIMPVHLFGHGVDSLALQCDTIKLERILAQAENRIITVKIKKDKTDRPVLTREVQRDALTGKLIHVDFYQVRMGEKVEVEVSLVLVGEAPALSIKDNALLHELHSLSVECLPDKIPVNIEVNLSSLAEVGQAIRVKDINVGPDVTVVTDPDTIIVHIIVRAKEKVVEKEAVAAEAPVEATAEATTEEKKATTEEKKAPTEEKKAKPEAGKK